MKPPRWPCSCDVESALAWLDDMAEAALLGDTDARRLLAAALDHFLAVVRREGVAA